MTARWDETWHRLREWTNGQGPSERLAAQILINEGFANVDPSHPLGGPDGGRDALSQKLGKTWVMAAYFPRGQQTLGTIKSKLLQDLVGVAANGAHALAFVTNQELPLAERESLVSAAGDIPVELYHLERITTILDAPPMASVRKQFLGISSADEDRLLALQIAEVEARVRIHPRIVPAGFRFGGGRAVLQLEVQAETQTPFRVIAALCCWTLDHDLLYAWTLKNHIRLLREPEGYQQQIAQAPTVVRLEAPLRLAFQTSSTELNNHFQGAVRRATEGVYTAAVPTLELARGEVEVVCEGLAVQNAERVRFAVRWGG